MCLFYTACRISYAWMNGFFFHLVCCYSEHRCICLLKFSTLEVKKSFAAFSFLLELFIQTSPHYLALQVKMIDGKKQSKNI